MVAYDATLFKEAIRALRQCETVLTQLEKAMPLDGIAQEIMRQHYAGSAVANARRVLGAVDVDRPGPA